MNLFFLDGDPVQAARLQSDVHIVKMILETMQMLCTALYFCKNPLVFPFQLYKPAHVNHPSTKWIRHSSENFSWALSHGYEMCLEYTRRYEKIHKCQPMYEALLRLPLLDFTKISKKEYDMKKVAFHDIPSSVRFVAIAIADEIFSNCAEYDDDNNLLAISTYRNYYIYKTTTLKRKMKWYKSEEIPNKLVKRVKQYSESVLL
tara:strand:+ start:2391 stop:2999 length:609 start_codon:yes stop_codon:yes gene_type:complete